MRFLITMFRDEDGVVIAECPAIPGCVSQGHTVSETRKNIKEAILSCLEVMNETARTRARKISARTLQIAV